MGLPTLIIVESPHKAKTISKYLGKGFIVEPTVGHIVDLIKTKTDPLGVSIDNNFTPKYGVIPDKKDKVAAIIDAAKRSERILIASDPDREGEAIAWHVANLLKDIKKPINRVLFKEITETAVKKAVANPGDLDKEMYDAQQARRVLDRLVGFMVSPYLWNVFDANCSAGRVQSVCLRMIVDREKEIINFIPEIYWNITAALSKNKKDSFIAKYPDKLLSEEKAVSIKKDLDESSFVVSKIDEKPVLRNPPAPLTTSRLQQVASAKFKFAAAKTMQLAQALYEQGYVSYIRTDSTRSSPESISAARTWLQSNGYDIPASPNEYKNKGTAQDAHEAIRPTDLSLAFGDVDDKDQSKLYKLIWEHFVASQAKPAIYDTVSVSVKASKGHELRANGRTLKYSGWLDILQDSDNEDISKLPLLKVGDTLYLVPPNVKVEKKQTQPPPKFNEGSLIKELEKKGIGRPSTYAAIIGKISGRNYVDKNKNVFTPTELGIKVIDNLSQYFSFMKYEYTADMEEKLDQIELGKLTYLKMMQDFFKPFKDELNLARNSQVKDGGHDCDICGKRMKLRHSKYGFYIACSGYPNCKNIKGVELKGDDIVIRERHQLVDGQLCPKCSSGMVRRDGQFGPFYSCSTYPRCMGLRKIPFGKKCTKCNSEMYMTVFNNEPKLACLGYPNCKNVEPLPPGTDANWISPKIIKPKKMSKKVERILSK